MTLFNLNNIVSINNMHTLNFPELQITRGIEDNSKIIFLISHRKRML